MFVCPRPLVRNSLFILIALLFLFCVKDSIITYFNGASFSEAKDPEFASQISLNDGRIAPKRELVLVQMLFRHGHRSPFMLYPYDPNSILDWKEGMGMLTQMGRLQHYMLGRHLRERYKGFITTNPREIEMINSNNFRCQYGAYCFVAGMYAPTKEYSFTEDIPWQPIVSRSANWQGKNILTRGYCRIASEEGKALVRGAEANATREKYKDLYNYWSKHSGRLIDGWTLASDLGKTLECEKDYNQTIPDWALKYWHELSIQSGISYYFNYGTKLIQKYKIGPLLGFMTDQINAKIMQKIPEKKVFIYSAHGSNIACLLLALDQYDWLCPPYASTIVLELWREDEDFSIRWLYFNSSNPEKRIDPPVILKLDGCGGEFCPLGRFLQLIRRMVPEDWEAECSDPTQKEKFEPFESPVHVPGLYSSASVDFSCLLSRALLLYILYVIACQ